MGDLEPWLPARVGEGGPGLGMALRAVSRLFVLAMTLQARRFLGKRDLRGGRRLVDALVALEAVDLGLGVPRVGGPDLIAASLREERRTSGDGQSRQRTEERHPPVGHRRTSRGRAPKV